jgi:hypothetical protein
MISVLTHHTVSHWMQRAKKLQLKLLQLQLQLEHQHVKMEKYFVMQQYQQSVNQLFRDAIRPQSKDSLHIINNSKYQ